MVNLKYLIRSVSAFCSSQRQLFQTSVALRTCLWHSVLLLDFLWPCKCFSWSNFSDLIRDSDLQMIKLRFPWGDTWDLLSESKNPNTLCCSTATPPNFYFFFQLVTVGKTGSLLTHVRLLQREGVSFVFMATWAGWHLEGGFSKREILWGSCLLNFRSF